MDEFGHNPAVTLVAPLEVAFDYAGSVVVYILHGLVGQVYKRDVVEVPLGIIEVLKV